MGVGNGPVNKEYPLVKRTAMFFHQGVSHADRIIYFDKKDKICHNPVIKETFGSFLITLLGPIEDNVSIPDASTAIV